MASIAVIDNDQDNLDVLQALLESQGHTVQAFTSGKDFVSAFRQGAFRLILMDLWMPDMDGYEVLETVRRQDPDVPVMAVTGQTALEDRAKAQTAGFADFVTKPFTDLPTFYAIVIKHLNHL
jgi:CheY-like chemotaxis protein